MLSQLRDLTRTCVLNGISAAKWESLVQQWKGRNSSTSDEVGQQIWSALRPLFTTHASEKNLSDYTPRALSSGLLPLHILIIGLLTQPFVGASTSSRAEVSTLDALVRLVIASLSSPERSSRVLLQVPHEATLEDVINAIHSAIELVKVAFSLPPEALFGAQPNTPSLQSNTTQLLVSALHSINRVDALSLNEATHLYSHLTDLAQFDFRSSPALLQQLSDWTNHISYHSARLQSDGQDLSAPARTSQPIIMYRSSSMTAGLNELALPEGSELAASVIIQRLVNQLPGSGYLTYATSELLALYRSLDMKAPVFCRSLILAALHLVSLCNQNRPVDAVTPMASFVIGRLPALLARWEGITYEATPAEEFRTALSSSLAFVLTDRQLIASCSGRTPDAALPDDPAKAQSGEDFRFAHHLVHSLATNGLLKNDVVALATLAPHFPTDRLELDRCAQNATDDGTTLEEYFSSKLDSADSGARSPLAIEIATSYAAHGAFAAFVGDTLTVKHATDDQTRASNLARLLYSNLELLEIVALHIPVAKPVKEMLSVLSKFEYSTKSDSHTAVLQYGDILLFVQLCVHRFKLVIPSGATRLTRPARSSTPLSALSAEERSIAQRWMHSIFSPTSEGIDDDLQRNTEPHMLLSIAPTVFVEAFNAMGTEDNREVLLGGASFFVGDLLKWTLPSVLLALCSAIDREGAMAGIHVEALQKLVTSPKCPLPALQIAAFGILRLVSAPFVQNLAVSAGKDLNEFRVVVCQALGAPNDFGVSAPTPSSTHVDVAHHIIRSILAAPPTAPSLIPFQALASCTPLAVLNALLQEISPRLVPDRDGVMVPSKSTTILVAAIVEAPRTPSGPTLLPFVLQAFTPLVLESQNIVPNALDALAVLIGCSVVSLRARERAEETVSAHFARTEAGSADKQVSAGAGLDALLKEFVRWLEASKADTPQHTLLQKIRMRTEYTAHFTFD